MGKVLFLKCKDYERSHIDKAVARAFDTFGGIAHFVGHGDKVLLKVNLVAGYSPERRVSPDPSVVEAVARMVLDAGGRPIIADSPGIDSFTRAARKAGLLETAQKLGIPCVELTDTVPLPVVDGATFKKIEVSRLVLEADTIINLPKLKTHGQMLLTLGVKNMFGCVVAQRKAEWHYRVGLQRDAFASLLLDIWRGVNPALTILDGVIGMDGLGPTNGKPHTYGVIAAACDALTMDFWLCKMLGCQLLEFPLWRAAKERGFQQCELVDSDLSGDLPPSYLFDDVDVPRLNSMRLLPGFPFSDLLVQSMTSHPVHRQLDCIGCGKCAAICPAGAIHLTKNADSKTTLSFDYAKCIRCYCCHEMCPAGAIGFKDGPLMKLMKLFGR